MRKFLLTIVSISILNHFIVDFKYRDVEDAYSENSHGDKRGTQWKIPSIMPPKCRNDVDRCFFINPVFILF